MSEPVTHAEIEDVLSSIRRLVSEDDRGPLIPAKPAPAAKPAPRLVLTPSLRVADAPADAVAMDEPEPEQAETAQVESATDADTQVEDAQTQDNPTEDSTASQTQAQLDQSPGISESENWDTAVPEIPKAAAEVSSVQLDTQPEVQENADNGAQDDPQGEDTVLLQTAVESFQEDQPAEPTQVNDAPWQNPDATLFAAAGVTETSSATMAAADTPDETKSTVSFAEKIAALEAAIGQADEQWEPEGDTGEDNSGTAVETLAWEDLEDELDDVTAFNAAGTVDLDDSSPSQVDITPDLDQDDFDQATIDQAANDQAAQERATYDRPEDDMLDAAHLAEQAVADEVLGGISTDEAVMDEESLRELVADIVREELQGALGERITRNVRKLVRREIQRALAVQDLG
ncbi:hypothetical protein EBB79_15550 [Parasedimentitalea marina]|uniref:Uncharacterized protein n=1 Tax=Parasedimentitalea marina TaxID=2483033 RepID=A0A3T0N593_9RHOB|nr:hypothetical protein [Parasedimentitalea marina]AZV79151.1 hypothetical protein EBB79_15550 [Parasedimentitalea marina]